MICRVTATALENYVRYAKSGRVVVFDTETTGIDADDQIIQLAAVEYVEGVETRRLCLYLLPSRRIHPAAEAVHHISRAFLEKNGIAQYEALERFFDFVGDDALLVAHNIRFDWRMLESTCRAAEFSRSPRKLTCCDTIALARHIVPGLEHYRLSFIVPALGLKGSNTHDALDDTLACAELFFALVRRIEAKAGED